MPHYRVHRIKDVPREHFRWAPHTGGLAVAKPKDYDPSEEIESDNPYAAWKQLMTAGHPLRPGDLLEGVSLEDRPPGVASQLQIAKYIGFEPAQWFVPESKSNEPTSSGSTGDAINRVEERCAG